MNHTYARHGMAPESGSQSTRLLEHYVLALRNLYDELFELNFTTGIYKILHHVAHKYVVPPVSGSLDTLVELVTRNMIHPDDAERFTAFFAWNRLHAQFSSGVESLELEIRKRKEGDGYGWAQLTVLPMHDVEDNILICYVQDIDARKRMEEEHAMLQEVCSFAVENEYSFVCLVELSSRRYRTFNFDVSSFDPPRSGLYDALVQDKVRLVHPDDRQDFLDALLLDNALRKMAANAGRHSATFRLMRHNEPRWTKVRLSYFKNNRNMLLLTTRDVHETYLREEHERTVLRQFVESFGSIYAEIVEANPFTGLATVIKSNLRPERESKNFDYQMLLSSFIESIVYSEDTALVREAFSLKKLQAFLNEGQRQMALEARCISTSDLTHQWTELAVFAVGKAGGKAERVLLTAKNVNDQKLLRGIVDRFVCDNCDYFIYIDLKQDNYTIFSSSESGTILPPQFAESYTREMATYALAHVAPEDTERLIEEMRIENVRTALNEHGEYILYTGVIETSGYAYKRLRYVYFDKQKEIVLLTRTDVTHMYNEEKRKSDMLRDALQQAEMANRAKTDFLSRMSHDIRTPMNAIMGMTVIAQNALNDREKISDCLCKIDTSSRYLLSLINDVLDMSKIENGAVAITQSPFDFVEFVRNITALVFPQAQNHGIDLEIIVHANVQARYTGDALRINQILVNLLANALKHTKPGGSVRLDIVEKQRCGGKTDLEFRIADTGCGMSEDFMRRMYEPFEQENAGNARNKIGTGLGLAIVRSLVDLMGGAISVHSERERGTDFAVVLPLTLPENTEPCPALPAAASALKVLVVEDDAAVRVQAAAMLKNLGLAGFCEASARRGLWRLKQAEQSGEPCNVLLVDYRMPGMNGIEMVKKLRLDAKGKMPNVFLMGYDCRNLEKEAAAAGIGHFLAKPLFQETLCRGLAALWQCTAPQATGQTAVQRFAGQRVLLVEDNEINMEIGKNLLECENLLVETAEHGQQAVDMFLSAGTGYYAAIIMDIRMPVMDGIQATRAVRALDVPDAKTIPIVAMSANAFQEDVDVALAAGMNGYVVKPIEIEKLYSVLEKVL